ncbi:Ni/Fe hydrogenase subunit alpha [Desulfobulbus alkaliphilus]|uniref:Ni/Fe hydrogenase subunit alpha n=1 Tax=Desulfobulbus alkaliphilus TaxID=869814 RepID=UPI0019648ED4|nr:Ni/Fe hydrogenase subunit alpha [Desulfobulbus alkaliphilus]MBM9537738.1 Ni/Fe hydrogenase subunit alpha [Desulfobulbus alkaliphilus]
MKKIEINPITRLEGHGKIAIFLDDNGNVDDAFFQTVEFRGFEKFLQGMPMEEVPRTVSTVCGVCRGVHFTASMKASDEVFGVTPPPTGRKLRELFFNAHIVEDHTVILYALGFPDFVVGPESNPAERNVVGLINAVGADVGREVLRRRGLALKIFELLGGKPNHPVAAIPGGWSKQLNEEERRQIEEWSKELVGLGELTLKVFEDVVLKNDKYMELVTGDMYRVEVGYMGSVDEQDRSTYYDGTQKVIDSAGKVVGTFNGKEYLDFISERVQPWTYLKFPYQKKLGAWQGIVEGPGTNIYAVGPLARMNIATGMNTPLAQQHFEKFHAAFGVRPVHNILGYHWARAIELLNAAENCLELSRDPDITSKETWNKPTSCTGEGIGIIEASRGTLIHHYLTDNKGIVTDANLIVATTHNNAPINLAVKKAAKHFIKNGNVAEGMLNYVEMAFRPYDLCLACATHTLTNGQTPLQVEIFDNNGKLYKALKNF